MRDPASQPATGFPPVSAVDARVLVLGSLPGRRSLEAGQYYAHERNAFWRIMEDVYGARGDYAARCRALVAAGVALWDVLESSQRPGSLDADIRMSTARPNDFGRFLRAHPDLRRICFNGRKAEAMFRKLVLPELGSRVPELRLLPSTSPAHTAMSFAKKLEIWRSMLL